ncbi:MAG TPA: bestrophin family ion channel [Bacteroidia bacterium]|nr:bestrophin family ion channel [Bacteroidia bacterium]
MHAGRRFTLRQVIYWTRRDIQFFVIYSIVITSLYFFLHLNWLIIPWVAIGLVGTAAAFLIGFKNTQTYNRTWEARQIWGAIVNSSRTWGILVKDTVNGGEDEIRKLFYRHFAWLTALRYQLREFRTWETTQLASNIEFSNFYTVPEKETKLEDELSKYLSEEELKFILTKKNKAAQLIAMQSSHLRKLRDSGKLSELDFIELQRTLSAFYENQGKSERIKNFPYPRQFATVNQMFVRLFIAILPFGIIQEFSKLSTSVGEYFVWATVPCTVIVAFVFHLMERIGEATENPFEGGANDVPISAISRGIEIDLRDMLNEKDLPSPLAPKNDILL